MRKDLTDITVVMDRSGSMQSCVKDAIGGINSLIEKQKKESGDALFTLVQFDDQYEFVHKAKPIKEVSECTLQPRGCTALLDAVGRAIVETGDRLRKTDESQRPGLVVFAIVTDGEENASKEYTKAKVKEMIEHQQNKYNWQFTFLGANHDAFAEAQSIGISGKSTMFYASNKTCGAFDTMSQNISKMRYMSAQGQDVDNSYSDKDRQDVI